MRNMNKKSQIGSTLVWIVATLIILFILIVYLILTGLLTGKNELINGVKKITGFSASDAVSVIDLGSMQSFLAFLNKEVDYHESRIKVREVLINSVERYNSIKDDKDKGLIDRYGIMVFDEPSDNLKSKMLNQGFDEDDWKKFIEYQQNDHEEMASLLINNFNYCGEFYLSIPQGILTKDGLKIKSTMSDVFSDNFARSDEFAPTISYSIIIGNLYEIKFRMLKKC